jgi:diaminopimelate epimerase
VSKSPQVQFSKYQALGNDYLVIEPEQLPTPLTDARISWICDRHYGIGADGVLLGPISTANADFGLRIFNPDGSEAEKSGNGLRIFARYLWDRGQLRKSDQPAGGTSSSPFKVHTPGGIAQVQVLDNGESVKVTMGKANFLHSPSLFEPVADRQIFEEFEIEGGNFHICVLSLGNPHCVILCPDTTPEIAKHLGPLIESHPRFPERTNVQFLQVLDRQNLRIEIWERGAAYTLASGSSSCAAAAAAYHSGLCGANVIVHNPGGPLTVSIDNDDSINLFGPAQKVFAGVVEFP